MARLHLEVELVEDNVSVGTVSQVDLVEGNFSFGWPVELSGGLLSVGLLLRDVLQVEDALGSREGAHCPVEAAEEVHEPAHVLRPVQEEHQGNGISSSAVLGDQNQGHDGEELGHIVHSEVEPAPAAVMGDEVSCGLVQEHVLLLHDLLLLAEGADD